MKNKEKGYHFLHMETEKKKKINQLETSGFQQRSFQQIVANHKQTNRVELTVNKLWFVSC